MCAIRLKFFKNCTVWQILPGNFGSTFIKFSKRFDKERVQTWKTALTEVANLSEWQLAAGYESK